MSGVRCTFQWRTHLRPCTQSTLTAWDRLRPHRRLLRAAVDALVSAMGCVLDSRNTRARPRDRKASRTPSNKRRIAINHARRLSDWQSHIPQDRTSRRRNPRLGTSYAWRSPRGLWVLLHDVVHQTQRVRRHRRTRSYCARNPNDRRVRGSVRKDEPVFRTPGAFPRRVRAVSFCCHFCGNSRPRSCWSGCRRKGSCHGTSGQQLRKTRPSGRGIRWCSSGVSCSIERQSLADRLRVAPHMAVSGMQSYGTNVWFREKGRQWARARTI